MLFFVHFKSNYHSGCYFKVKCTVTYPTCNGNGVHWKEGVAFSIL